MSFARLNSHHKKRVPNQLLPYPRTKELEQLFEFQKYICGLCNDPFKIFHLDHILQIQFGGAHVLQNLRFTHPWCNLSRDRTPPRIVSVTHISVDTGEYTDARPW